MQESTQEKSSILPGTKIVKLRFAFYRDSYRLVIFIFLLSLVVNAVILSALLYVYTHPPKPRYFPTSINGRIIPIYPLDKPNQPDSAVLQWAVEAAMAAYSYDWVHYRQALQAASEFFTPYGWSEFVGEIKNSNNLSLVQAKKMVVSASALRAPQIIQKEIFKGTLFWRIRIPISVVFQNQQEFSQDNLMITMLIQRVSTLNQPRGLGIAQFIAEPIKSDNLNAK